MSERIPDFVVIGAMKAGAAALYRLLRSHPGVFMPALQETDFFVAEKNWSKGLDWYRSLFADAPAGALLGESSTNYSKGTNFRGVPERLRSQAPDVKIIYLLRDPIQRTRSHYDHAVARGREERSPEAAIRPNSTYVRTSLYGAELQRYLEQFPSDQILVALTEDLRDEPEKLLLNVQEFLGLEPFAFNSEDLKKSPVEKTELVLPTQSLDAVRDVLAADRQLLQRLVSLDLSKWQSLDGR